MYAQESLELEVQQDDYIISLDLLRQLQWELRVCNVHFVQMDGFVTPVRSHKNYNLNCHIIDASHKDNNTANIIT